MLRVWAKKAPTSKGLCPRNDVILIKMITSRGTCGYMGIIFLNQNLKNILKTCQTPLVQKNLLKVLIKIIVFQLNWTLQTWEGTSFKTKSYG